LLEGLEVDQYIWGIAQSLTSGPVPPCDEVTIDSAAHWKPVPPPLAVANDQQDIGTLLAFFVSIVSLVITNGTTTTTTTSLVQQ